MIVNRLLAALQVDDRETAHRESDRTVDVETIIVGTAMTDRVVHARQQLLVNRFPVASNDANDATHNYPLFCLSRSSFFSLTSTNPTATKMK